jgi:hypothetical protein
MKYQLSFFSKRRPDDVIPELITPQVQTQPYRRTVPMGSLLPDEVAPAPLDIPQLLVVEAPEPAEGPAVPLEDMEEGGEGEQLVPAGPGEEAGTDEPVSTFLNTSTAPIFGFWINFRYRYRGRVLSFRIPV